jgi:hypothetical protein
VCNQWSCIKTEFLCAVPLFLPPADAVPVAAQAAHLCKADLATSMVTEMTALAGTMGRHYALKEGLPAGKLLRLVTVMVGVVDWWWWWRG